MITLVRTLAQSSDQALTNLPKCDPVESLKASNSHQHSHTSHYGRLFGIGILLNVAYVVLEASFGWHIDSLALLADAAHNFGDVAGLVLAWL